MMNVSLALNANSPQLRVSFTFDWPDGPILEVKIEGTAPGYRADWDLREVHRMVDNLRYSKVSATSCPECDRHQVMAILRRSIERGHLASDLPAVSVTIRDEHGAIRSIPVSPGSDGLLELERALRSLSAGHAGHRRGLPAQTTAKSRDLSVH